MCQYDSDKTWMEDFSTGGSSVLEVMKRLWSSMGSEHKRSSGGSISEINKDQGI